MRQLEQKDQRKRRSKSATPLQVKAKLEDYLAIGALHPEFTSQKKAELLHSFFEGINVLSQRTGKTFPEIIADQMQDDFLGTVQTFTKLLPKETNTNIGMSSPLADALKAISIRAKEKVINGESTYAVNNGGDELENDE